MSLAAVSCTNVHNVTGNKYKFAQIVQEPVAIGYKFGRSLIMTLTCYSRWCLILTRRIPFLDLNALFSTDFFTLWPKSCKRLPMLELLNLNIYRGMLNLCSAKTYLEQNYKKTGRKGIQNCCHESFCPTYFAAVLQPFHHEPICCLPIMHLLTFIYIEVSVSNCGVYSPMFMSTGKGVCYENIIACMILVTYLHIVTEHILYTVCQSNKTASKGLHLTCSGNRALHELFRLFMPLQ